MASNRETFWDKRSFAFVGHSSVKPFPKLSYAACKKLGRRVVPVDPSADEIEGDVAYSDLRSLPEPVDAVVIEVPKDETADWVRQAGELGIKDVWIHQGRDTPEALSAAEQAGINLRHGTCAVMYVQPGFSIHGIHRGIEKLRGTY